MTTYAEKLKDPRWQKKRLEVLQRAEFTCEACGDSESTLHVHHGHYVYGQEPWEARLDTLHCFCEMCHDEAGDLRHDIRIEIAKLDLDSQRELFDLLRVKVNWKALLRYVARKAGTEFDDRLRGIVRHGD